MNMILCTKSLLPILFSLYPSVVYAFYLSRYHQVFPTLWLLGCFPTFFSSYYITISHIYFHFSPQYFYFWFYWCLRFDISFSPGYLLQFICCQAHSTPTIWFVFRTAFAFPCFPCCTAFWSILKSCSVLITPTWSLLVTPPTDVQIPHLPPFV